MATMTRRELLKASGTAGLVLGTPAILSAQSKEPIPIGTLCPLTGAGGSYGPDMLRSVAAVNCLAAWAAGLDRCQPHCDLSHGSG